MSVHDLDTPERDLRLRTRKAGKEDAAEATAELPDPAAGLRDRLALARALQPGPAELHCVDCWRRGRDAALRFIEEALA